MTPQALHRDAVVIDGHVDTPTRLLCFPADLSEHLHDGHVDLPRLRDGGVTAPVFALFLPPQMSAEAGLEHARSLYRVTRDALAEAGEAMVQVVSAEEIRRAKSHGRVAVLLGLENGRPLSLPGALDEIAAMGVRYVTLTHTGTHEWCDASTDEARHGGLSKQGEDIVFAMSKKGILPDASHVSDDAVRHMLEVSKVPVIASHSSARALCDHPRNLPDDLIRAIASKGGVVMANCYPAFLDDAASRVNSDRSRLLADAFAGREMTPDNLADLAREREEFLEEHTLPPVPLATYVDHILHLVEVAGEEHVGIGTDFDGIHETPEDFDDAADFPALTEALLDRGLPERAVRLILGESFLRVLDTAERAAG